MKEQKMILQKIDSFELTDIFECGQCFRWNQQEDGSYEGIFGTNILKLKKEKETIQIEGFCEENIQNIVEEYFDLKRDYQKIKKELAKIDENMKKSIQYGQGIRLLNQDLWEMIVSFIISANNNIPRIKGIIERMAKEYGKPIRWRGKTYYTFPTPEELKNVSVEEYLKLGLGFRDKRVYETTQMVVNKQIDLEKMQKNPNTWEIKQELLNLANSLELKTLSGVGSKVADCILLFSNLKRLEIFPIDVWIRRVMNELYIKQKDENKINKKQIEEIATQKFGEVAGLAQQYLYYWKREDR